MSASLVGSEMCIRDRSRAFKHPRFGALSVSTYPSERHPVGILARPGRRPNGLRSDGRSGSAPSTSCAMYSHQIAAGRGREAGEGARAGLTAGVEADVDALEP
eukprot:10844381-Alexandrium_andersonii.AAC.1